MTMKTSTGKPQMNENVKGRFQWKDDSTIKQCLLSSFRIEVEISSYYRY